MGGSVAQSFAHNEAKRPAFWEPQTACLRDGEGRNRTGDTTIFSRVLYQLSYLAAAGDRSGDAVADPGSARAHPVPVTAHRDDVAVPARIVAELAAQIRDVDVDHVVVAEVGVPPDPL